MKFIKFMFIMVNDTENNDINIFMEEIPLPPIPAPRAKRPIPIPRIFKTSEINNHVHTVHDVAIHIKMN